MADDQTASLYGIVNSNRNFADPYYWGKNQFNSAFPVALACYMRDGGLPALYIRHDGDKKTKLDDISFSDLFNSDLPNKELFFGFEKRYEPYESFVEDDLKPIDLVAMDKKDRTPLRPLEVKLTTLPDDGTSARDEISYGSEIVVRSPTMRYMALSMGEACRDHLSDLRSIFEPACHKIRQWENTHEVIEYREDIFLAVEEFLDKFRKKEKPLLLQPIWKTVGRTSALADNCLDIFVWSDFALARLFMDSTTVISNKINRPQRAALRLARFLYELSKGGRVYQQPIYDGMTYDTLNDKEFAVSGAKTNHYMKCERLAKPAVSKQEIKRIVLGGGQKYLKPERRFDAILYFSKDLFDE